MLPLFESAGIDLSAPGHADGSQTLLHPARSPAMCTWLLEHGALPGISNDDGELPEAVLPDAARVVIARWRLERGVAAAQAPVERRLRLFESPGRVQIGAS